MTKLRFPQPLEEGLILARPNRFLMDVEVAGSTYRCHCPSTGRIGHIAFQDVPCLLSKGDAPGRRTPYTVEAISPDPPGRRRKRWIGINQGRANEFVEFFLRAGALGGLFPGVRAVAREVRLGSSRIDFLVNGRDYLEVKMPLNRLYTKGEEALARGDPPVDYQRLLKHFADVGSSASGGSRAIFLLCFVFDAPPFRVPPPERQAEAIVAAARRAETLGVEHWQANMAVGPEGVELLKHFRLHLF